MRFMFGSLNPRWRGGKSLTVDGYIRLKAGKDRDKMEHRKMWEDAFGPIPEGFDVHHIDEVKTHNVLSNFELRESVQHRVGHLNGWKTRKKKVIAKS